MRTVRRLVPWLLFVALATAAFAWLRGDAAEDGAPKPVTAAVARGPISAKVTATGTVSALVTVDVGSQVSGRIKELLVDYNSPVRKGQVIARLDPQLFEAALDQARANHLAAEANLKRAKAQAALAARQLARNQELSRQNLVAVADLDVAQTETELAQAQIEVVSGSLAQARASLAQARLNLEYATITSPIDGIVISRSVDVGQTVAASLQAPVLVTLAEDLRKMQVNTSVAEADVGRLAQGMKTYFTVDAFPDESFAGTVRQIRNAPTTTQNVVTYDAVIDVANPELKLRPGMTANVTFVVDERADALRVPNAALRFKPPAGWTTPDPATKAPVLEKGTFAEARGTGAGAKRKGNRRTVWAMRDGAPVALRIATGITDGSFTEVVEGDVRDGDQLVTDVSTAGAPAPAAGATRRMRAPGMPF